MRKHALQGSGLRAQGWARKAPSSQPSALLAAVVALVCLVGATISGHDIPNDVTVQIFLAPEGQSLKMAVRVPLQAMRDMDYPKPAGARNTDLLDLGRAEPSLRDAATLWISDYLDLYENGRKLPAPRVTAVRAALQSDKSFASYAEAIAHLAAPPLPVQTEYFWSQGMLDVLFEYPIESAQSPFAINPRLARLGIRTLTVLRFLPPAGAIEPFEFVGDPGPVQLDPSWSQTVSQFVARGFREITGGAASLLFLVCLAIPFRSWRSLAALAAGFTAAHSITLIASAYNLAPDPLWFPPLIDTLIAVSVLYMALENVALTTRNKPQRSPSTQGKSDRPAISARSAVFSERDLKRRWLVTFAAGLAFGFGYGFGVGAALQFAGAHPLAAVLSFNAGVEVGLLVVLALVVPAFALIRRFLVAESTALLIVSALIAHTAWHWMNDRWLLLRRFTFERPPLDAALLAGGLRAMMLVVTAAALYWVLFGVLRPPRKSDL